uniref:Type II antifreeze protein n=1 Tax=Brachyopsis segaliensis TaxID=1633465 RepID=UPI00017BE96C|nr:Chain A, Type II antifreeze protein [Brachyopsis segaliensis]
HHHHHHALVCPAGWTLHGQRCFYSEATAMTWDLAEANCVNKGGHLASIHSLEEQLYIKDIVAGIVWIGGSACKVAGAWSWTDGTPVDYRTWCPTKPNDILSDCCMQMTAAVDKCWDDLPCPASHASICAKAAI